MRFTPTRSLTLAAVATLAAAPLALAGPAQATKPPAPTTGIGKVFMVNPVQSTGDQGLTDQKDSAAAVPASAYATVPLRNLDGSGYLRGAWANVESSTGTPAYSLSGQYVYDRSQDQFEQVMGYFWVNQAQEYLQGLGFTGEPGALPAIVHQSFPVKINQYGGDNSYQTDSPTGSGSARAGSTTPRTRRSSSTSTATRCTPRRCPATARRSTPGRSARHSATTSA
jgi:hypothetical protein